MVLPKAPNTAPRRHNHSKAVAAPMPVPVHHPDMTPTFPDYDSLRNNYITMLQSNNQSNALTDGSDSNPFLNENLFMETSPLFSDLGDDFLTPMDTPLFDFEPSPLTSPLDEFLTTPIFQDVDEPVISADYEGMELFADEPPALMPQKQRPSQHADLSLEELYTFSPTSPLMDSFSQAPYVAVDTSYRTPATGTRKGTTAETMISLDAPTQPRHYRTPSATSRKAAPAAYSRKRTREEDEDLGELPDGATEQEQIAHKRRQNTVAARKSRKRKLEYTQTLEQKVSDLEIQIEHFKLKTEMYHGLLQSHGLVPPMITP